MPRPNDSPDVAASKTLSYILRHGAEKEGLHIRSDGYIKLDDVLARPKMRDVDKSMVFRLVEENAKKRFELFYGYDPSPPPLTKGKGQGKGQGQGQGLGGRAQKRERAPRPPRGSEDGQAAAGSGDTATAGSFGNSNGNGKQGSTGSRAAQDKAAGPGGESKEEKRNRRAAKLAARAGAESRAASLHLASSSTAARGAELNDAPSYSTERESLVEETSGMSAVGSKDTAAPSAVAVADAATPDAGASTSMAPVRAEIGEAPTLEPRESKSQPQPQPRTDSKSNAKPQPKPKPEVKSGSAAVPASAASTELPLVPLPLPSIESTPASVTGSGSIANADADANAAAVSDMTDMTQGIAAASLSDADPARSPASTAAAETLAPASTPSANNTTSDAFPPRLRGEYFIRASQGHSIALASTSHLVPITYCTTTTTTTTASTSDTDPNPDPTSTSSPATQRHSKEISPADRARAGLLVHGTHLHLYPLIASTGLSRMGRQHIHLAPALSIGGDTENLIAPRTGSTLLIYLDLDKLLAAGIQVYTSANGVVLTPGDADGRVKRELWRRVEEVRENGRGERVVIWDAEMGDVGEA